MDLKSKMIDLFNHKMTIWYVLLSLFTFIGIGYYIYQSYVKPTINPTYVENRELTGSDDGADGSIATLYLFSTAWCPHCKTITKGESTDEQGKTTPPGAWSKIKSNPDLQQINNYSINHIEIDGDDEKSVKEWEIKYNKKIEGFPTIILVKDDEVIEFDANPTEDTLTAFLKSVV